ncbi:MAG TPA: cupin domain-containing protein [Labilithrix sp.]
MQKTAFIVTPDAHHPLKVVGETIAVLADSERTGSYEVFLQQGPEGAGPPPHHHPWDESYYVLEGEIDVLLGDRTTTIRAGEFVHVPAGTLHNFRMRTNTAKFLSMNNRGGASGFFRAIDREVGAAPDIPKIMAVAAQHEVRLGPPPGAK